MTQPQRLLAFLRSHPGATTLEINDALHITNATGRISDLRKIAEATGAFVVVKERREDGRDGYSIEDQPVQLELIAS